MNIKNVLFNRKGNVAIWVCALVLIMLTMGSAAWEYSRLNIVAQGSRDAVQAAITQVCTENYNQVYNGVREGYAGGYKLDNLTWVENVDTSNITSLIDKKIGTLNGVKTTNGKMEYMITDLSVQIKNAPLAPTDTDGVQQFTGSATYNLTVPLSFGWQGLPPMVIPMNVSAGYSPKGALSGSGSGSADIPATGIGLSETSLTLEKGGYASLSATVNPDDATDPSVSWVSSDNGVATVNQAGLVTGMNAGATTILALSEGGIAQCNVQVIAPVTDIQLDKHNLTIHKGGTDTLMATLTPDNASDKSLWWTTSDPNICTVDATGKVTGVNTGTAEILVASQESGAMARCAVTVDEPVTGITLDQSSLSVYKGANAKLTATVYPVGASNQRVLWASSDPGVAMVDQTGSVNGVDGGTAIISATTIDGQFVAQCTVTVIVHVTGITLNRTDMTLVKGTSSMLTATVWPMNATDKQVSWSSLNPVVASVDNNGQITANSGGTTIIYATTHDGGFTAQCTVTVNVPVTGVSLDQTSITMARGSSKKLYATVYPSDASNKSVSWSSSNSSVASVDGSGNIYANQAGTATITAQTADGGFKAYCSVTVVVPVTGVSLNTSSVTMYEKETYQLYATVSPADATNKAVTWSSGNLSIASVTQSGLITAISAGTTTVYARTQDGGYTASATVVVKQKAIEWTCTITPGYGGNYTPDLGYGNSATESCYASGGYSLFDMFTCLVTYNFKTPLQMKAGQTLDLSSYCFAGTDYPNAKGFSTTSINGVSVYSSPRLGDRQLAGDADDYKYTFTTDTTINSIGAYVSETPDGRSRNWGGYASLEITVNSDIGSFLLNSSGTSNQ